MRDLIDAPDLSAFADNEHSTFTVRSAAGAEIVLSEIDTRHNTEPDWETYTLLFHGAADAGVESGIHHVDHPRLGAFDLDLRPIHTMDMDPDARTYQATFARHVPGRTPHRLERSVSSRRGFVGALAAAVGGAGILGGLFGSEPARAESTTTAAEGPMGLDPFLGEIILFGGNFAIRGFAFCDGQLLPISQNSALFALLGTIYGGDGRTTFALPDLRGRVPIHTGQGPGLSPRTLGQKSGQEQVTLTASQIPAHQHGPSLPVSTAEGNATSPDGNALGAQPASRGTVPVYSDAGATDGSMAVASSSVGGNQGHNNMPPFQVISYQIALQGIFPSRS